MSVSKKYKRNRNYRKKRNSRKLKRAGGGVDDLYDKQFNHSQNYEITRKKVSDIIGEFNIDIWNNELKNPKFIHNNTDSNENPKDMIQFFPDIMKTVPYFQTESYEQWQKFYDSNNNPNMEDNKHVMNTDIGVTQNYNYEFKEDDANETLKNEFRTEYGIMFGTDLQAAQDRYLYVRSLMWAHGFDPEKHLPDNSNRNKRGNRYIIQDEYIKDKQEYQNYLDNQTRLTLKRNKELINEWRKENKGTYWDSKYNLFNNSKPQQMGGRKTRKRRKSKKSKHSKKSRRSRRRH